MRTCCINDCYSNTNNAERTLFEVTSSRIGWMSIIRNYQTLDSNQRLYICDLHFDPNNLQRKNGKFILQKSAEPAFFAQDRSGMPANGTSEDTSLISHDLSNLSIQSVDSLCENYQNINDNEDTKTITMQEYVKLVELIPKYESLKKSVNIMEHDIKSKSAEIKELRKLVQHEQKRENCYSNFTTEQKDVIDCLTSGIVNGSKYNENVRKFCLRQFYYSPAAYESMRSFFNKNLPSKRTIQMWYSSIDGGPGISSSALAILREKAQTHQEKYKYPLHVTLISDEMAIRKQISWNPVTEEFIGFSTITSSSKHVEVGKDHEDTQKLKTAKEAIVFLIVGTDFKLPVGYHLLNGLEGIDRAALTLQCIECIEETGIKLMCLTSDGLKANITVANLLGADLENDKTYFISPSYPNQKIYIIMDPPHMLKLVRKHFSKSKLFYEDQLLDFDLLRILEEKQRAENFNFCNKLTQRHINWHQKPMNVMLAGQTMSKSVADAVTQLRKDGYKEFANSEETSEFIHYVNDCFDVMNFAANDKSNDRFKLPICEETADKIFTFLNEFKAFIKEIQIEKSSKKKGIHFKPVIQSSKGTGFKGFCINISSLNGIYLDFIKNGHLTIFHTFQMSQDHLETLFSLIRNAQGRNDNPNSIEFCSAFRKLMVCHPLITSMDNNVISNSTMILTVPATRKKKIPQASAHTVYGQDSQDELLFDVDYESLINDAIELMEPFDDHMSAYVALMAEEKMTQGMNRSKKSRCTSCLNIFSEDLKINDNLLAMKHEDPNVAKQPCLSTLRIVIFTTEILKIMSANNQPGDYKSTWINICENLNIDDLYSSSNFEHENNENHKIDFITQLVKIILNLKSEKIGKRVTEEETGVAIRNRYKTKIHVAGQ